MIRRPHLKLFLMSIAIGAIAIYALVIRAQERERLAFEQGLKASLRVVRMIHRCQMLSEYLKDYQSEYGHFPSPEDGLTSKTVLLFVHDMAPISANEEGSTVERWLRDYKDADIWYDPYNHYKFEPFNYISNGEAYCIVSQGPDNKYSMDKLSEIKISILNRKYALARSTCESASYDPTNGLISNGDIYVTSSNIGLTSSILKSRFSSKRKASSAE